MQIILDTYSQFPLDNVLVVLKYVWFLAPLWGPFAFFAIFWHTWMRYIQSDFIFNQGWTILEIRLPKEINKSPAAMEIFFAQLYQTGAATEIETYWGGKVRPWYSFELVSLEGQVKFYIWTLPKWKDFIEAQLYAQYPTIEIHEVPDYTTVVQYDLNVWSMWITYFILTDEDPLPIKTYVDYGMDKDPKEEVKIDPISSVIEYLGSLRKGEYAWIQILAQAHKKEKFKDGRIIPKPDWKERAFKLIKKIQEDGATEIRNEEGKIIGKYPNMTPGQTESVKAIERSVDKYPFEVAIRGAYIAKNESMRPININGLIGAFRQYSSPNLNGFKLGKFTDFDYPWEDFKRMRRTAWEKEFLDAYKRRSFFNPPYKHHKHRPYILTTEELATIFHLPGGVVQTPTFDRIPSRKVEAPANLPI